MRTGRNEKKEHISSPRRSGLRRCGVPPSFGRREALSIEGAPNVHSRARLPREQLSKIARRSKEKEHSSFRRSFPTGDNSELTIGTNELMSMLRFRDLGLRS